MEQLIDQYGKTILTIVQAVALVLILTAIFGHTPAGELADTILIKSAAEPLVTQETDVNDFADNTVATSKEIAGRNEPVIHTKGSHASTILSYQTDYVVNDLVYAEDADGKYFDSDGYLYDSVASLNSGSASSVLHSDTSYIRILGVYDTDSNEIIYDTFNKYNSSAGDYLVTYDSVNDELFGSVKNPLYDGTAMTEEYNRVVTYKRATNQIYFDRAGTYTLKIKAVDTEGKSCVSYVHVAIQPF